MRTHPSLPRRGFTLVELLIVIMIIMVLAGLTVGAIRLVMRMRDEAKAKVQIELLATALDSYKATYGVYPPGDGSATSSEGLRTALYPPQGAADGDKVFLQQLAPSNGQGWGASGPILDPFKTFQDSGGTKVQSSYRYRSPGTRNLDFDIWSFGQDGVEGTGDDITNW